MPNLRKNLFAFLFSLFFFLPYSRMVEARDPKMDEMGQIQEISYYLIIDTQAAYHAVADQAGTDPIIDEALPLLEKLSGKAQNFYKRAMDSTKSPWRTARTYKELNEAFTDAKIAFIAQPTYFTNPEAFEEIAYWMGGLLQYYLYPPINSYGEGIVYSYSLPNPGYAQAVYSWMPTFYTFSSCRNFPWRISPWGRRVWR
jgi:hypothetical protein